MFENLKVRIFIIFFSICFSIYFLMPTLKLYFGLYETKIEYNEIIEDSIGLGLDLKGGLRIILELDGKIFLKRLAKKNLSQQSENELEELINLAHHNSLDKQSDIVNELASIISSENLKLNKFYSNLSKSSNNDDVIAQIKEQKNYAITSILEIMRNRINDHDQYGLGEPSIQQIGDDRLVVELAGITDLQKAKDYIQRTADFELTLVKENSFLTNLETIEKYLEKSNTSFSKFLIDNDIMKKDDLIAVFKNEIQIHNKDVEQKNNQIDKSNIFQADSSNLFSQLTEEEYIFNINIKDLFNYYPLVQEKHYIFLNDFFKHRFIEKLFSSNSKVVWGNKVILLTDDYSISDKNTQLRFREIYTVSSKPAVSAGMIQNPKAVVADIGNDNAGQWVVNLDMTKEGRRKWSNFTAKNINKRVAILLDNEVFMAPYIRDKITAGSTQISGFNDMDEAKDIASVLKAGELPAPIHAIQTSFIGPSLGKDSIDSGALAMLIGIILVFVFMILYYRGAGFIASFALIMNIFIVLSILVTMDAVLTLPGIAGLLLTVGMTVDANVIIFERIKEEISLGIATNNALFKAYDKAFITILDANVTTLLTAFVLSFIGSGPIKGFATTLSVGIICSMFTAIFVTKTIFTILLKFNKKLSI